MSFYKNTQTDHVDTKEFWIAAGYQVTNPNLIKVVYCENKNVWVPVRTALMHLITEQVQSKAEWAEYYGDAKPGIELIEVEWCEAELDWVGVEEHSAACCGPILNKKGEYCEQQNSK